MKPRTTWLLLGSALALFAYILWVERHTQPTAQRGQLSAPLLTFQPANVTSLRLHRTNQFVLQVDRTNGSWTLSAPLVYPAQLFSVEGLLQALTQLTNQGTLRADELRAGGKSAADFGLDKPAASLALRGGDQRLEIAVGARTPPGDQVYVRVDNSSDIQIVSAEWLDRLPQAANAWRDPALVNLHGMHSDRFEVRMPGRGYAVAIDPTHRQFVLTKPTPARASRPKVEALLRAVRDARVKEFLSDDPRLELEPYGLQPPGAELVFASGTNELMTVAFGKSPTNDAGVVYARRLPQNNLVLVPLSVLQAIQIRADELRDRYLFSFAPDTVDAVEVKGPEGYMLRRQPGGGWTLNDPSATAVDAESMREFLLLLTKLEGAVEKDVVTDFTTYGLVTPAWQIVLRGTLTNANSTATNRVLAHLDLGGRLEDKVFVRRADEPATVYALALADFLQLPAAGWQLRDRRVFSFSTNDVLRVTIQQHGYTRQLTRNTNGAWALAPGSVGIIRNTFAVEETIHRLGELRAAIWVARGEEHRGPFGFTPDGHKLVFELKRGDKGSSVFLEFGGKAPSQYPYALTELDGQPWIFEFPLSLYFQVLRDLSNPPR